MNRVPVVVWFLVPSLIITVVGVWFFSRNPGAATIEQTSAPQTVSSSVEGVEEFGIVSQEHINQGLSGSGYNSNPPTSGQHWPTPVGNGIYEEQLADEQVIHNLEHGYIWISYKSDVPDEVKAGLREIVSDDDWKIVLEPREENDANVVLAAWGRLLKMDEPDYEKVREFIRTYRNRGPEKTPN